jgi:glutathione S-transferase
MKLYFFPPSPNVRKVNAVISYLGIQDIDREIINLAKGQHRSPKFLAINPMGKLPALDAGGGLLLWESNAICQFLCERHGETPLYPRDPRVRADMMRWLFWDASAWSEATTILTTENVRKPMLGIGEPDPASVIEGEEKFKPLASLLNDRLASRPFLTGEGVTLADFAVGGSATYMERGRFPVADFPHLQAWWARLHEIAAWTSSIPSADLPE